MENFQYHYNEEEEIFYFSWEGETRVEDVANVFMTLINRKAIPQACRMLLSDHRSIYLLDNLEEYIVLDEIFHKHPEIFKDTKLAIIVDAPKVTASFLFFNNRIKGVNIRPFSTINGAKKWLKELR